MRRLSVGAVALATMAVGCASIVGIDGEYELLGGGGAASSNGSGNGSSSATSSGGGSMSTGGSGGGAVTPLPSCAAMTPTCGAQGEEEKDCCTSPVVPGGTFNRNNNPSYPATVSDFRLDRFEVTVGRFRAFVAAYPGSKPNDGDGAHLKIQDSGWKPAWNEHLPVDQSDLIAKMNACIFNDPEKSTPTPVPTWTDAPGANEELPINCISWYEAFAFCAWDGGRLPTEAEWNYASAGGAEQRKYPWGSAAPGSTLAVYGCTGDGSTPGACAFSDILRVGSKPKGAARWGQMDMAGSLWEFTLDWYTKGYYEIPCIDCANQNASDSHVAFGGSWLHSTSELATTHRGDIPIESQPQADAGLPTKVLYRDDRDGVRCAREM